MAGSGVTDRLGLVVVTRSVDRLLSDVAPRTLTTVTEQGADAATSPETLPINERSVELALAPITT